MTKTAFELMKLKGVFTPSASKPATRWIPRGRTSPSKIQGEQTGAQSRSSLPPRRMSGGGAIQAFAGRSTSRFSTVDGDDNGDSW